MQHAQGRDADAGDFSVAGEEEVEFFCHPCSRRCCRLPGGSKPLAEICEEVTVTGFEILSKIFCGLLCSLEIAVDLFTVIQVVGYSCVNLGKR